MAMIWSRMKQYGNWAWVFATAGITFLVWLFFWLFSKRNRSSGAFDDWQALEVFEATRERLAEANARAALEIHAAREKDQEVTRELDDISKLKHRRERLDRLVALRQRMKR